MTDVNKAIEEYKEIEILLIKKYYQISSGNLLQDGLLDEEEYLKGQQWFIDNYRPSVVKITDFNKNCVFA